MPEKAVVLGFVFSLLRELNSMRAVFGRRVLMKKAIEHKDGFNLTPGRARSLKAYDRRGVAVGLVEDAYHKRYPRSSHGPHDGICHCGEPAYYLYPAGLYVDGEGRSHNPIQHCRSWACPVCSQYRASARADEIADAVKKGDELGLRMYFLTFTVPHRKDNTSAFVIKLLQDCFNRMVQHKAIRELKERYGYVGFIKCLDYTLTDNGTHAHFHSIWFFNPDAGVDPVAMFSDVAQTFACDWDATVYKARGRHINPKHGFNIEEIGDSGEGADSLARYAAKAISFYVADSEKGKAKHPFDCLDPGASDEDKAVYLDFYKGQKGRKHILFSRGFRERLDEMVEEKRASYHPLPPSPRFRVLNPLGTVDEDAEYEPGDDAFFHLNRDALAFSSEGSASPDLRSEYFLVGFIQADHALYLGNIRRRYAFDDRFSADPVSALAWLDGEVKKFARARRRGAPYGVRDYGLPSDASDVSVQVDVYGFRRLQRRLRRGWGLPRIVHSEHLSSERYIARQAELLASADSSMRERVFGERRRGSASLCDLLQRFEVDALLRRASEASPSGSVSGCEYDRIVEGVYGVYGCERGDREAFLRRFPHAEGSGSRPQSGLGRALSLIPGYEPGDSVAWEEDVRRCEVGTTSGAFPRFEGCVSDRSSAVQDRLVWDAHFKAYVSWRDFKRLERGSITDVSFVYGDSPEVSGFNPGVGSDDLKFGF